jgi:hypothetical protein
VPVGDFCIYVNCSVMKLWLVWLRWSVLHQVEIETPAEHVGILHIHLSSFSPWHFLFLRFGLVMEGLCVSDLLMFLSSLYLSNYIEMTHYKYLNIIFLTCIISTSSFNQHMTHQQPNLFPLHYLSHHHP